MKAAVTWEKGLSALITSSNAKFPMREREKHPKNYSAQFDLLRKYSHLAESYCPF